MPQLIIPARNHLQENSICQLKALAVITLVEFIQMSEEVANCRDGDNTGVIRLVNQVIWHLDMTYLPSSLECTTRGPPESPWNIYFPQVLSSVWWHTAAHLTGVSAPVLVAGTHEDLRDNLHTLDTLYTSHWNSNYLLFGLSEKVSQRLPAWSYSWLHLTLAAVPAHL